MKVGKQVLISLWSVTIRTAHLTFSFGDDGIVTTDFDQDYDMARGLAIQPDGKIVVVGRAEDFRGVDRFAVARYLQERHPRPELSGTMARSPFPLPTAPPEGRQSPSRLMGGSSLQGTRTATPSHGASPDGSLDTSFGNGGTTTIDIGGDGAWQGASDLALQSDGKFVVAGTDYLNFALARFNSDGSLDNYFGQDGTLITDFGGNDWCNGVGDAGRRKDHCRWRYRKWLGFRTGSL